MTSRKKKNDFFWVSFSDLMTSLFFVMLVLFVITVTYLKMEQDKLTITLGKYQKMLSLDEQFKLLREEPSFYFLEECNKYVSKDLMGVEIFMEDETAIKGEYIDTTIAIGRKVQTFLEQLDSDFSYLLIIEGNVANTYDKKWSKDRPGSYGLSYDRALTVYNLWLENDICFRKSNVEVLIAGSGLNGLCREPIEDNNKRFSIQIVPKISEKI